MKIKLLLTALISLNVAAPIFAGMYASPYNEAYNIEMAERPKLRKTILQKIKDTLNDLERTYHIKELSSIIAANIFMISVTMRMQEQLTSPKEFNLVKPDANLPGFKDIIGLDDAKQAAKPLIDYLQTPQKFIEIGAQVPKGCILTGAPGTGKTEFARALAQEAKIPVLQINGSDFNTMWRGSGTKQLKKLEITAKATAQKYGGCIVYIDEIDNLVGKANGNGFESDTNATTCTFKSMLDGFNKQNPNTPIFYMGSTNNPGIIDPAIIRDGRMPLIPITTPTLSNLETFFDHILYKSKFKTAPGIDTKALAQEMYFDGYTCANGKALINTAAMYAAAAGAKEISKEYIVKAICNTPRLNAQPLVSTPVNYNKGIGAIVDSLTNNQASTPITSTTPQTTVTPEQRYQECGYCKGNA